MVPTSAVIYKTTNSLFKQTKAKIIKINKCSKVKICELHNELSGPPGPNC